MDPVNPVLTSETRTDGPSLDLVRPLGEAESHLALMNEAIAHWRPRSRQVLLSRIGQKVARE
jgi:hypothetical protein